MRRWIFAVLLLLNVGLLLWGVQYLEPERPTLTAAQEEVSADKMKLLSEVAPGKMVPRPKPAQPPPVPTIPTTEGQLCYRLGPIADAAQAKRVETALAAQTLAFTKREESGRSTTSYRIYLPSFPSKEEAERKRRELTRLGFRDHALMQDEGLPNAISLGLFSVEANARSRMRALAEKGVTAHLQTVEQAHPNYWFDLGPAESVPARLKAIMDGLAGAELRESPCPAPVLPAQPVSEPANPG